MAENELQRVEPPQSPIERIAALMAQPDSKIDTAAMEKLLDMQERYDANEARKDFAADFAAVQSEIEAVVKTECNPQTKSKYAGLGGVIEMSKPVYTKHGFSIIYYEGETEVAEHIRVCADVLHRAGHKETYHYDVPLDGHGIKGNVNMTKIHGKASSVSYGRRYLLCMIWNIPTQDDDGNGAGEKPPFEIPDPSDKEQIVIEAIALKIPAPDGMRVDPKKLRPIFFGEYQRYPADMQYVDSQAEWISGMGLRHIYMPDKPKDEFDEFVEQQGDMPAADAEATAAEKFGKENEIVECRFVCNHCSNEYDTFKKIDQCPKCLHRDVTDRRPE